MQLLQMGTHLVSSSSSLPPPLSPSLYLCDRWGWWWWCSCCWAQRYDRQRCCVVFCYAKCTDTNKGRAENLHGAAAVGGTVAVADASAGAESSAQAKRKLAAAAAATSSKWMEMVSNRSLASDLIESAALARVLPLLAADPKISPADVYAKTRVRTTQNSLDDAAAHVLSATKAFDQLSGAGFDAVRAKQRQTMPNAPAAPKVATAAAPLSAPPPSIRLCW